METDVCLAAAVKSLIIEYDLMDLNGENNGIAWLGRNCIYFFSEADSALYILGISFVSFVAR